MYGIGRVSCNFLSCGFEVGGEVAQKWRLVGEAQAADLVALVPDFEDDLDDVVDVALGIGAAGDGKADEIHLGSLAEHQRADLDGADAAFEVKFGGESYAGELFERNVGHKGAGIKIDGVASGWLDDGDSCSAR